jgi:hypothetical protein
MKTFASFLALVCFGLPAPLIYAADAAGVMSRLEGYTIILSGTITGYRDRNGKREDSFNGCDFDRLIIFDDNKALTCNTYSYTYSYRPTAVILSNGSSFKMVVGGEIYDMRR